MPTSFTQLYAHIVAATKHRQTLITPEVEARLYPFIGGIIRDLGCTLYEINGTLDHFHILVQYRADLSMSDLVRHVKSRSSKWVREKIPEFRWQECYGGFTVSKSQVPRVKAYIRGQKEHHRKESFESEYRRLLKAYGIEFDERDLFD
jgi:putative transposase